MNYSGTTWCILIVLGVLATAGVSINARCGDSRETALTIASSTLAALFGAFAFLGTNRNRRLWVRFGLTALLLALAAALWVAISFYLLTQSTDL